MSKKWHEFIYIYIYVGVRAFGLNKTCIFIKELGISDIFCGELNKLDAHSCMKGIVCISSFSCHMTTKHLLNMF